MKNEPDTALMIKTTRKAVSRALGVDVGLADLGRIIGYDGSKIYTTIKKIQSGERGLSSIATVRMRDILHAASMASYSLEVIPEWMFLEPAHEEAWDGSSIFLDHIWFPRLRFVASVQGPKVYEDLNYALVGKIKTDDPDLEEMDIYVFHTDLLPQPEWYTPFYEHAIDLLTAEANRQTADIP